MSKQVNIEDTLRSDKLDRLELRSRDTSLDYAEVDEILRSVPALCQTVRAAWKQRDDALVRAAEDQDYNSEQRASIVKENATLRERIAQLERGEFICQRCHHRKDAEHDEEEPTF